MMKKEVIKSKIPAAVFTALLLVVLLSFGAKGQSIVDVTNDISFDGLSLRSSADDIEKFISKQDPEPECLRQDIEGAKSHHQGSDTVKPRNRRWQCMLGNVPNSPRIHIKMLDDVIIYFDVSVRYDEPYQFNKTVDYIKSLHEDFESKGIVFDQSSKTNYGTYMEQDYAGSLLQQLKVNITADCDDKPVNFNIMLSASKFETQKIYGTGIKIQRSEHALDCTDYEI